MTLATKPHNKTEPGKPQVQFDATVIEGRGSEWAG